MCWNGRKGQQRRMERERGDVHELRSMPPGLLQDLVDVVPRFSSQLTRLHLNTHHPRSV